VNERVCVPTPSDHVQAICEHASQEDVMGPAVRPVAPRLSVTHGDMN